jgi:NitT/TauT family transport system substrate-binding protein
MTRALCIVRAAWMSLVALAFMAGCTQGSPTAPTGAASENSSAASLSPASEPTSNAASAREPLRLGYSSIGGPAAAVWVAKDAGFFDEQGLDVELLYIAGGSALINAVIAGETPYAGLTGLASINAYLSGADTIAIAAIVNQPDYQLMVGPEVQTGADLRGKALAIARLGSASDFAARYLAQGLGLVPEQDVALLQVGDYAGRLAALQANQAAGALMESPFTVRARQAGFHTLASARDLGLETLHWGIITTRAQVRDHPSTTERLLRAIVGAIHFMKTDKAGTIAIMARYQQLDPAADYEALEDQYDTYPRGLVPRLPLVTENSIRTLLDSAEVTSPRKAEVPTSDYYDNSFLLRLETSGLLRQLYGE